MGLSACSDEFCSRIDAAIQGLSSIIKLVDDILIQAKDMPELERLHAVLDRCRQHGITLSASKAEMGSTVTFAGLRISHGYACLHPDCIKAITSFPGPIDVPKLRSFLGLAVQLASLVPDLVQMTDPVRCLLKKNVAFVWLNKNEEAFQCV